MEGIAAACGAYVTYDIHLGLWAFVLNESTSSIYDFDDSNIIGAINVSGSGLTETYNSVEVQFPHRDLNDQKDYRRVSIPESDWLAGERPNRLVINVDYINDPVQAEMMALRELKQSRMDQTVEFTTDFNALGLNAGDIFTITNDYYGMSSKQFRCIRISEEDTEDGLINLRITGLEWSTDIDNYGTITRFKRDRDTGIKIREQNTDIDGVENESSLKLQLTTAAEGHGLKLYYNSTDQSYTLDFRGGSATAPGTPGTSVNTGNEVRAVITWEFTTGEDLDIRARVISHSELGWTGFATSGNNNVVGYTTDTATSTYQPSATYKVLTWGGDNEGTGEETCLVDIGVFIDYMYALGYTEIERYFIVECHGNFYDNGTNEPGYTPVQLSASLYNGGTPNLSGFTWRVDNYGAGNRIDITGVAKYIYSNVGVVGSVDVGGNPQVGDLMGYFILDLLTYEAYFADDLDDLDRSEKLGLVVA
jgi:hypothetical protein